MTSGGYNYPDSEKWLLRHDIHHCMWEAHLLPALWSQPLGTQIVGAGGGGGEGVNGAHWQPSIMSPLLCLTLVLESDSWADLLSIRCIFSCTWICCGWVERKKKMGREGGWWTNYLKCIKISSSACTFCLNLSTFTNFISWHLLFSCFIWWS